MKPCQHASYCPCRMRDGDRPGGCDIVALRNCSPRVHPVIIFTKPAKKVDGGQ